MSKAAVVMRNEFEREVKRLEKQIKKRENIGFKKEVHHVLREICFIFIGAILAIGGGYVQNILTTDYSPQVYITATVTDESTLNFLIENEAGAVANDVHIFMRERNASRWDLVNDAEHFENFVTSDKSITITKTLHHDLLPLDGNGALLYWLQNSNRIANDQVRFSLEARQLPEKLMPLLQKVKNMGQQTYEFRATCSSCDLREDIRFVPSTITLGNLTMTVCPVEEKCGLFRKVYSPSGDNPVS